MRRGSTIRKEVDYLADEYEYEYGGNVVAFINAEKDILDDCTPLEVSRYKIHKDKLLRP